VAKSFSRLREERGLKRTLAAPVNEPSPNGLSEFLFGRKEVDAKRDSCDTSALAVLTFGDTISALASIDPRVIGAADFSRIDDISDIFSFSVFADRLRDRTGVSLEGSEANLHGYVAEQIVAQKLVEQGYQVSLPGSSNQPGFDMLVDDQEFQVKCRGDLSGLEEHFSKYPDIPVFANSELADEIAKVAPDWMDKVFYVDGFSQDYVESVSKEALDAGAEALDYEIPAFSAVISGARSLHGWWRGDLEISDAIADFSADVVGKGTLGTVGAFAGKGVGLLLFGPAGAVVFGGVVAVLAASQSRRVLNTIKTVKAKALEDDLRKATEKLLASTETSIDIKLATLNKKKKLVKSQDVVADYVRDRFDDDIEYFRERKNELSFLRKATESDTLKFSLLAMDAVRRAKVHPSRLQVVLREFFESFEALGRASESWRTLAINHRPFPSRPGAGTREQK